MTQYALPSAELADALTQNRLWYHSAGKRGGRACWAYESHPGLDLAGAILSEATLQEADLHDCCLDGASCCAPSLMA
ncbi:MAG: pentapeptide repeat-containing protein [Chloroflexota bacterium]|nr:pentapeptide repeat-containing protein [Chloroflexota bacterium]